MLAPVKEESAEAGATLCPRCHDHFKNPRILPCAHVMCRDCVVSLLEQLRTACCPRCNYHILDPCQDDDRRAEDIADDLSEDKATTVLVECAIFLQQSHSCCACDEQPALWVCLHCGDLMCNACVTRHRKFSSTRSHDVEELSALSPSTMAFRRRPSSYRRSGGTMEMYCRDHKVALTSHAAGRDHRKCSEVNTMEDECQEVDQTLSELTVSLCTSEQAVHEALLRLERFENDEARKILNSLGEGQAACDQLEKAVAERRRQFQESASRAEEDLKKVVLERRMFLKEQQSHLASHVQLTQSVKGMGVSEEKVEMLQALQKQVGYSLRTNTVPQDLEGSNSPLIAVNSQLLQVIETAIGCLGYVVLPPSLSTHWEEVVNFIVNTSSEMSGSKPPLSEILSEPECPLSEVLSEGESEPESPDQMTEGPTRQSSMTTVGAPEASPRRAEWSPIAEDVSGLLKSNHFVCPNVGVATNDSLPRVSRDQVTEGPTRRSSLTAADATEASPRQTSWSPGPDDVRRPNEGHHFVYVYRDDDAATDEGLSIVSRDQESFRFHTIASRNIEICDTNRKAKAKDPRSIGYGLLFSLDPMRLGHLYEVHVKHVVTNVGSEMSVGVCFQDPDTIRLPNYAIKITRKTGVIISPQQCNGGGEQSQHNDPRRQLKGIPDGRRVGVLVDSQQWLHVYINGIDCGRLIQLKESFFYAMFELYFGVEEVNSLPVREEHQAYSPGHF